MGRVLTTDYLPRTGRHKPPTLWRQVYVNLLKVLQSAIHFKAMAMPVVAGVVLLQEPEGQV